MLSSNDLSLVNDFAKTAKAYCDLIERYKSKTRPEFIQAAFLLITNLLNQVMLLPHVGDVQAEDSPTNNKTNENLNRFKGLTEFLGDWDPYREVFNGILMDAGSQDEVVGSSLSDDFSDIYSDLNEGLEYFKQGKPEDVKEAIWQWRFGFEMHWGRHATSALRAIYLRVPNGDI